MLLSTFLILTLTGCKSIQPVTAADYQAKVEKLGYSVVVNPHANDYEYIKTRVEIDQGEFLVTFMKTKTVDDAIAVYNQQKSQYIAQKGSSSVETTVETSNLRTYTLKSGDAYCLVEQAGATVIFSRCHTADSAKLDAIIKAIGY